jgi:aerobic-type carbon monoxide dehydrogenase small subunit (CoxS/CutS family)
MSSISIRVRHCSTRCVSTRADRHEEGLRSRTVRRLQVIVNGQRINSCLTLAVMHAGDEIVTVEGLAQRDDLHPMQAAFVHHDGLQCATARPARFALRAFPILRNTTRIERAAGLGCWGSRVVV